jgi:hypothetical protein
MTSPICATWILSRMVYMDSFEDGVTPSEMAEDVFEENGVDW